MTTVALSPLPGPRASHNNGDAGHARRSAGEADFAAALSETAGEAGEDLGGGDTATIAPDRARTQPKVARRLDAREHRMAAVDKAGISRAEIAADDRVAEAVHVAAKHVAAGDAARTEILDIVQAGDPADAQTAAIPDHPAPRAEAVRDVLAVLGVDLPVKPDVAASAAEFMTSRRHPASGASTASAGRSDAASREREALSGLDIPGDVPEIDATPVKVLRQETHFSPIAQEARRLLGMSAAGHDERTLPVSLAAATRISRPLALQRESQEAPTVPPRALEATGSLISPSLVADQPALGSIGQQIADGVQRAIGPPAEQATSRSAPIADPAAPPAFAPALRTVKLQLNPLSLGVVTIVLTGGEGDLRIHLEAERAETFGKVDQERGALSARLNGAGYAITELTVGRMGAGDAPGRESDLRDTAGRHGGQSGDAPGSGARDGASQFADQRAGRNPGERALRDDAPVATSVAKAGVGEQVVSGVSYAGRFRPV